MRDIGVLRTKFLSTVLFLTSACWSSCLALSYSALGSTVSASAIVASGGRSDDKLDVQTPMFVSKGPLPPFFPSSHERRIKTLVNPVCATSVLLSMGVLPRMPS